MAIKKMMKKKTPISEKKMMKTKTPISEKKMMKKVTPIAKSTQSTSRRNPRSTSKLY